MSETLAQQLQIKPHSTVWVSDPAHIALLTPMPEGVRESDHLATASTAVFFAQDAADAREQLQSHATDLGNPSAVWVACARSSEADLEPVAADLGMRTGERLTLDDTWSALRLGPA